MSDIQDLDMELYGSCKSNIICKECRMFTEQNRVRRSDDVTPNIKCQVQSSIQV
jgi:hypothetical protein